MPPRALPDHRRTWEPEVFYSGLVTAGYFRRLARYNRWANRRLYAACAMLTPADYEAERPSFFGSIHRTLNHALVGDRIWLGRFVGRPSGIAALDQVLYDDFATLHLARQTEDARLLSVVGGYDERALDGTIEYRNTAGEPRQTPVIWALAHLFNHQTHHRGQVHSMLSATPVAPPPLDLIYFLPDDDAG